MTMARNDLTTQEYRQRVADFYGCANPPTLNEFREAVVALTTPLPTFPASSEHLDDGPLTLHEAISAATRAELRMVAEQLDAQIMADAACAPPQVIAHGPAADLEQISAEGRIDTNAPQWCLIPECYGACGGYYREPGEFWASLSNDWTTCEVIPATPPKRQSFKAWIEWSAAQAAKNRT